MLARREHSIVHLTEAALALAATLVLADCRAQSRAAQPGSLQTLVVQMTVDESATREGREFLHRTGSGTKWIDLAGNRRRDEFRGKVVVLGGAAKEVATTLVFDGKRAYSISEADGRKVAATKADLTSNGKRPLVSKEGVFPALEAVMQKTGHGPTEESFLGRTCRVFRSLDGTQNEWIWNGILLKTEVREPSQAHTVIEQATDVQENALIEESRFAAPAGVRFETAPGGPAWIDPSDRRPWAVPFYMRGFGD